MADVERDILKMAVIERHRSSRNVGLAQLGLPIASLMSDQPTNAVRDAMDTLLINSAALGSALHDPFVTMSLVALEVITSLKLTDQGLVDVKQFKPVPLFVE